MKLKFALCLALLPLILSESAFAAWAEKAYSCLINNDSKNCKIAAENYFRTEEADVSAVAVKTTPSERMAVALCLKWALFSEGSLNNNFLSYSDIPEMGLLLPFQYPIIDSLSTIPFCKAIMASGVYVPAMSSMICFMDKYGIDSLSAELFIDICASMGRKSLALRYISYLPKEKRLSWHIALDSVRQEISIWDSIPYNISSEPFIVDDWVSLYYPLNAEELASWKLDADRDKTRLDYYTLMQLLHKKLERLPFIIDEYKRINADTLPTYVQEALLLSWDYMREGGISKEGVEKWKQGSLSLDKDIIKRFEDWFVDIMRFERGFCSISELQSRYPNSYLMFFVFDGIQNF